jgi:hypothetical protein
VTASVYGSTNQEEGRGQQMKTPAANKTKRSPEQGTLAEAAKSLTVVQFVSGRGIMIDCQIDEILGLIAEATKPENER